MGVQSDVADEGFNNTVLWRGCTELGYPVSSVPCNALPDHYYGWCHLGCKDGKKKGATETWLADVARSGNGLILPDCKVRIENVGSMRQQQGVLCDQVEGDGGCGGGAEHSGFAEAERAEERAHREEPAPPPVGAGVGLLLPTRWPEASKQSYEGGIITCTSTALAKWEGSGYGAVLQTPALHPGMFAALMPWVSAAGFRERMLRFARTAHVLALVRDKGSGAADRFPESLEYLVDEADEESMQRATEAMVRVLAAAGAEEVGTQHCEGERARVAEPRAVERLLEGIRSRGRGSWRDGRTPLSTAH